MARKKTLKLGDMKSREDYLSERQNYTDQQARKLGYPSAEVMRLSDELTQIAGQWRRTKDTDLVRKYRQTLYEMILKGYNVDTLPVQDQLPEELMPELPPQSVRSAITQAYETLLAE